MLVEINKSDLKEILLWRNHPDNRKNMYSTHVISWDEHCKWFDAIQKDDGKRVFKCLVNDDELGVVNFSGLSDDNKNAFWGFYTKPDVMLGGEVILEYESLSYAFEKLSLHKLNCEVLSFNKKIINLHLKSGFKKEGVLRDYYFREGKNFDVERFGMLATEWSDSKKNITKRIDKILKINSKDSKNER